MRPGNTSAPEFTDDFSDHRYAYDRMAPGAWVRLRFSPLGEVPLHPYLGYALREEIIHPYPGSLLAEQRPDGLAESNFRHSRQFLDAHGQRGVSGGCGLLYGDDHRH